MERACIEVSRSTGEVIRRDAISRETAADMMMKIIEAYARKHPEEVEQLMEAAGYGAG